MSRSDRELNHPRLQGDLEIDFGHYRDAAELAVALPMAGSGDSLNVSTTAAIMLYEAGLVDERGIDGGRREARSLLLLDLENELRLAKGDEPVESLDALDELREAEQEADEEPDPSEDPLLGRPRRVDWKVRHPAAKRRRDRQAARRGVVFHVVGGRVSKYDLRRHLAYDCSDFGQCRPVIENL